MTTEQENIHSLDKTVTGLANDFRDFRLEMTQFRKENSKQHNELQAEMAKRFDVLTEVLEELREQKTG